ncbi:metal ABC transporter substrate-binding protein [Ancylobacter polymorphus]|jgi:zinc/manganese transport system substrate-binding protein|uniref:Zinc/manganese transport system substrate-binding protein n=1 Tax=Ancylobacter polymorphus TaxID=223390 RepID=A0ABU0BDZ1_9HYPH|nr:metal ABC transporter substrate-binding protein [Ancylobacter polymorphus]MDQ0304055.1 zinc/manganese transport system substrate-binding protein [Ancylobacter polymorphus]
MLTRRLAVAGALALGLSLPLALPAAAQEAAKKIPVVASFSILGDFVKEVGGDRVSVTTLVGPNGDAHVFQPAPADAKKVASAQIVFVNGLGFEGWIDRLVKASGTKAEIVVATKGITPREMADEDEDDHAAQGHKDHDHDHAKKGEHDHDHGGTDPHAWQSVANAEIYVANIRDALIAADPAGKAAYEANASAYTAKLEALDAQVKAAMAAIPESRRRIITSHDAFGYFGAAYGVEFIAPQGVSTESEASAKDVARIIRQIKAENIPAVFMENISDPRLVKRIAKETQAKIGGELFSDALSDDKGPASTYIDMMKNNITQLSSALSS